MLLSVVSLIVNAAFIVLLHVPFYTDRAPMPDGSVRKWSRSPVGRLQLADNVFLLYLQIAAAAVCAVTSVLVLCGAGGDAVRKARNVSLIVSAVLFLVILIVTGNSHAKYA